LFLRAVKKRLASSSFDRFSSTNPVHDLTEAIQTRFDAEGFETSPAQSRRMRSLFLLKEHKYSGLIPCFGSGGEQSEIPHIVATAIRDLLLQNVDELFI